MPPITDADIERVIARYDEVVRANTSDAYDAIGAVIDDEDDEVGYEAMSLALDVLGVEPSPADNDRIYDAAQAYRERLRAKRLSANSLGALAAGVALLADTIVGGIERLILDDEEPIISFERASVTDRFAVIVSPSGQNLYATLLDRHLRITVSHGADA